MILKGIVEDRRIKRMAEDCVAQLPGISEVQNQLRTASSHGNKRQATQQGNQAQGGGVTTNEPERSKHRA